MARSKRLHPIGILQHIIQCGNNHQACFCSDKDFSAYANWLKEYSDKYHVKIHAWIFMANQVNILATPLEHEAISSMMQALGRMYVRYYNHEYQRSGTLWGGRFKSSLVQSEKYFLLCSRYIEMTPVRAGMVANPVEYKWSSYHSNALGTYSPLYYPQKEYLILGDSQKDRCNAYRNLFKSKMDRRLVADMKHALSKGMVLGSEKFKDEIEANYRMRVKPGKVGRPRKEVRTVETTLRT